MKTLRLMCLLLSILHPTHRWGMRHVTTWYTLPMVIWAAGLAFISLVPPIRLPSFAFDLGDKLQHWICYFFLSALLLRGYLRSTAMRFTHIWVAVMTATLWGLYLEYLQSMTPYRTFDWWDALSNAAGAVCGAFAWKVWRSGSTPR